VAAEVTGGAVGAGGFFSGRGWTVGSPPVADGGVVGGAVARTGAIDDVVVGGTVVVDVVVVVVVVLGDGVEVDDVEVAALTFVIVGDSDDGVVVDNSRRND